MSHNIFKERGEPKQIKLRSFRLPKPKQDSPSLNWLLNEVVFHHTSSGLASACVQVNGIMHYKTKLDLIIVMLSLLLWQVTHDVD